MTLKGESKEIRSDEALNALTREQVNSERNNVKVKSSENLSD